MNIPSTRDCVASLLSELKACTKSRDLQRGKELHSSAIENGNDSITSVSNTLINMYAKCGSMPEARRIFDTMQQRSLVSWTILMFGYVANGKSDEVLELFACMQHQGSRLNGRIFVATLKACISQFNKLSNTIALERGMTIHSHAVSCGCDLDAYVASTLVVMYSKGGSMTDACKAFEEMHDKDVVAWNALILGYVDNGEAEIALELLSRMMSEGCAPDSASFLGALKACIVLASKEEGEIKLGSLEKGMAVHHQSLNCDMDVQLENVTVDMYARCGSMVDAHRMFGGMAHHDVVSWTVLILGYADNGDGDSALELFSEMQATCTPNSLTFVAALKACIVLASNEDHDNNKLVKVCSLEKGMIIHSRALGKSNLYVESTLVDLYAKCSSMHDARHVFDRMPRRNVISWTALMLGYADNGDGEEVLRLFSWMQREGCSPDMKTYAVAVKASGMVGAVDLGKKLHVDICARGFHKDTVLATCLLDFYTKCGSMVDAQQVFDSITEKDYVVWHALISGYSRHGDTNRVFDIFNIMQKIKLLPNATTFLCVLTACSHAGLVNEGKEYFKAMSSRYGIKPEIEHYTCIVDMLGRANRLDDAVALLESMPVKPNKVTWTTVLGACRKWKNVEVAKVAFQSLLNLEDKEGAQAYVSLSNIYTSEKQ